MGWKISAFIIHPAPQTDHLSLLKSLGYQKLIKTDDEPFEVAMNPDDGNVFIGTYKNNLLVCTQDIPVMFFDDGLSDAEQVLIGKFPQSEICSVVLHSVVNLWGYAVIKNGRKIRTRAGSGDEGTFLEIGEPLEEEKELLRQSTVNEVGARTYQLHTSPGYTYTEDQVGENFVFEICKRYFGESLDSADDLLFETTLSGYSYSVEPDPIPGITPGLKSSDKPWWKFW